ncbi:Uncharacterised protein [Actinobaculum suis]|uniref:Uncharacterized protein n=1 Tax=Actinobaculum suis TaxID=1657 RepID=A0A7Z8Y7E8_9ACTO|nr:Uncharacterised protein [Actinobaculum suis]
MLQGGGHPSTSGQKLPVPPAQPGPSPAHRANRPAHRATYPSRRQGQAGPRAGPTVLPPGKAIPNSG